MSELMQLTCASRQPAAASSSRMLHKTAHHLVEARWSALRDTVTVESKLAPRVSSTGSVSTQPKASAPLPAMPSLAPLVRPDMANAAMASIVSLSHMRGVTAPARGYPSASAVAVASSTSLCDAPQTSERLDAGVKTIDLSSGGHHSSEWPVSVVATTASALERKRFSHGTRYSWFATAAED